MAVRIFDHSADNAINAASDAPGFAAAEAAVLAGDPQHFASRLGKIENRRSELLEAAGDSAGAALPGWIAQLLWMVASIELTSSRRGGSTDPFVDGCACPDSLYAEAYARAQSAPNALLKAIWLRCLWVIRERWRGRYRDLKMPRFDAFARECAEACAAAAEWWQADPTLDFKNMASVYAWAAALECVRSIDERSMAAALLPRMHAAIKTMVMEGDFWAIRLLDAEVQLYASGPKWKELAKEDRLADMRALCESMDSAMAAKGFALDHMRFELVDLVVSVGNLDGKRPRPQEVARRRAEITATSAATHPSHTVRAGLWADAAGDYQEAGDTAAADKAVEESRREVAVALKEGEFKAFPSGGEVSRAQIRRELAPYLDATNDPLEALARAAAHCFIPWLDDPAGRVMPSGFVSQILPRMLIIDDRVQEPEAPSDGGDVADWQVEETLKMQAELGGGLLLCPFFDELRGREYPLADALMAVFISSPVVVDEDIDLLLRAVDAFVAKDFTITMHLLPPRLERIVSRTLRRRGGGSTSRRPGGALQERTFGALIDEARSSKRMPEALADLAAVVLTSDRGLNIRNNVAHGLMGASGCGDAVLGARLMHVALALAFWSLDETVDVATVAVASPSPQAGDRRPPEPEQSPPTTAKTDH